LKEPTTSTDFLSGHQKFQRHRQLWKVVHVRLTNDNGQVFEDTVQNGLILFASIQDKEVHFPMQAKLFDNEGKLVWRETVLNFKLS